MTYGSLTNFISADSKLELRENDMWEHVLDRIKYFTGLLSDIKKDLRNFDFKPIYCALYK